MQAHDISEHIHHEDEREHNRLGELRTRWVVAITTLMMIGELVVGWWTGSVALKADGWHMGTHVGALGLTLVAYWYARTRAGNDTFSFGTGKVYALAGYTSGVLLAVVAVWMAVEGATNLITHPAVDYRDSLPVAALGFVVNIVSTMLLSRGHHYGHGHGHGHGAHDHHHAGRDDGHHDHGHAGHDDGHHDHGHAGHDDGHHDHGHAGHDDGHHDHGHAGHDHGHHDHGHAAHGHGHAAHDHGAGERVARVAQRPALDRAAGRAGATASPRPGTLDFNLRAAYIHIMADAMTSLAAVVALSLGWWAGLWYLDPLMGLVGGGVIVWWAVTLCRQAGRQLLDVVSSPRHEQIVRERLEAIDDVRVADLHVWELGPGRRSCIVSVVTARPREVGDYRDAVLSALDIAHLTIEVHQCGLAHESSRAAVEPSA